jgi:hypothetical protein
MYFNFWSACTFSFLIFNLCDCNGAKCHVTSMFMVYMPVYFCFLHKEKIIFHCLSSINKTEIFLTSHLCTIKGDQLLKSSYFSHLHLCSAMLMCTPNPAVRRHFQQNYFRFLCNKKFMSVFLLPLHISNHEIVVFLKFPPRYNLLNLLLSYESRVRKEWGEPVVCWKKWRLEEAAAWKRRRKRTVQTTVGTPAFPKVIV